MSNTEFTKNTEFTASTGNNAGNGADIGGVARETGEQARQAGAAAMNHARDVASEARSRAGSLAGALGEQAAAIGEAQKDKAADALEGVAKAIHKSGEQLEGNQDWAAHLVERGAAELNILATALRRNDIQGLLDNLSSLARRQPAVFVGASMAAGFLLTRIGRLAVESGSNSEAPLNEGARPNSETRPAAQPANPLHPLTDAMSASTREVRDGQF